MSAPISRARSTLKMILAVLPAKSPTVGLICARAMRIVVINAEMAALSSRLKPCGYRAAFAAKSRLKPTAESSSACAMTISSISSSVSFLFLLFVFILAPLWHSRIALRVLTFRASIRHFNRVNNSDNRRIHRPVFQPIGHARAAARNDQHLLAKSRADSVDSHQITALVLAGERDRADEQELFAFEARVLARRHNVADDASDDHKLVVGGWRLVVDGCL